MLRSARPLLRLPPRATGPGVTAMVTFRSLAGFPFTAGARSTFRPRANTVSPVRGSLTPASVARYSVKVPLGQDIQHEKEVAKEKLASNPAAVTVDSTVRKVFEKSEGAVKEAKGEEEDVFKGIKSDLQTLKETFDLSSVPRLPYTLGLAGTLPYLATSLSSVYLGWNLRTHWPTSSNILNSFMVSNETAEKLLHLLEPIQLGYGAVIISFLGAIHWGLEYSEKSPSWQRTRFRYTTGVLAPVVAWPTLLMPIEYALITQFAAFTGLYFADSLAAARGWAPPWYGSYRFVLTFVVGSAIVVSLLGRARTDDPAGGYVGATERLRRSKVGSRNEMPEQEWRKLEAEEKERIKKEKKEAERKKREAEEAEKKKKMTEKKSDGGQKAKGSSSDEGGKEEGGSKNPQKDGVDEGPPAETKNKESDDDERGESVAGKQTS